MTKEKEIKLNQILISNKSPFVLIAGPCVLESREHALMMASKLKNITDSLNLGFIYKTSYDKANRTSVNSPRGLGLDEAIPIFTEIREKLKIPILTDVHDINQCNLIFKYIDVIQIPAFLCRQTDLLLAAAKTKKIINIKKGQFLAPWDMINVAKKISNEGNENIMFCERGVSFGYNTLVSDMRSIPIMAETGYPIVFDATHSVQQPGGQGTSSGGERQFVPYLARAAIAVGVASVFMETHDDPDNAPSDGPNMIPLSDIRRLLEELILIDKIVKKY
jgi:2-dehydro-3-deoxyphosphooctonate aldolase (KDO 8-P synthase)